MNATEAQSFDSHSLTHEMLLAMAAEARGCACEAYRDWYTYDRWQAQGYQVRKNERGVCLTVYRPFEETDAETGKVKRKSRPWRSYVFCRCQVDKKGGSD